MAEKLSLADARQLYGNSLLMYKDNVVFLTTISADFVARIRFLSSSMVDNVKFNTDDFKPIGHRLGFVNYNCMAVFLTRKPVRLYSVGITSNNIEVGISRDIRYTHGIEECTRNISGLGVKEIDDTIKGVYPPFVEAQALAKEYDGTYAFDRQFAIHYDGSILYKNKVVGYDGGKSVDKIEFNKGYEYLNLILGNRDAKDPRNFRPGKN